MNLGKARTGVMIWQGMFGNGVTIGTKAIIITLLPQIIR